MERDSEVTGIVLAGGRGRRMGAGEKCLCRLGAGTLLEHAITRAATQVSHQLISFNGDPGLLPDLGCPVLRDPIPGFAGPLAGILAGLEYLRGQGGGTRWLASFACDTPGFPADLVRRLRRLARDGDFDVIVASCANRLQPVFALWSLSLATPLREQLSSGDMRKAESFIRSQRFAVADWPADPRDPFFNINTPEQLEQAEMALAAGDHTNSCAGAPVP